MDIESTLRKAIRKVFKDSSVSKELRAARAEALLHLADVFRKNSQSHEMGLNAFKDQLKDEMKAAEVAAKHREQYENEVASAKATEQEKRSNMEAEAQAALEAKFKVFSVEELRSMKPKQLKEIMIVRSIATTGCTEKEEYVQAILTAQNEIL